MTRKDYVAIAKIIADNYHDHASGAIGGATPETAIRFVARDIAEMCHADNPRFDVGRFMQSCKLDY